MDPLPVGIGPAVEAVGIGTITRKLDPVARKIELDEHGVVLSRAVDQHEGVAPKVVGIG